MPNEGFFRLQLPPHSVGVIHRNYFWCNRKPFQWEGKGCFGIIIGLWMEIRILVVSAVGFLRHRCHGRYRWNRRRKGNCLCGTWLDRLACFKSAITVYFIYTTINWRGKETDASLHMHESYQGEIFSLLNCLCISIIILISHRHCRHCYPRQYYQSPHPCYHS